MRPRQPVARPHATQGALALCLALAPVGAFAQRAPAPDRFEPVRAKIQELISSGKVPSVAVAVAQHGRIVWEEGFGLANIEAHAPATAATPYSLASISKPFTATGLMELVEAGRIDLDRPANDYLGSARITGLAGDASLATVRRVASHMAGLPLHYQFFYRGDPYQRVNMDTAIARYAILVNPPGQVFEYSNLGYGIVDYIIERATGEPYEKYMAEHVFAPLGLTSAFIGTGAGHPEAAVRYGPGLQPIPFYDFDHRGGSAVWASAHDLVRFGMFHLKDHLKDQKRILRDATLDTMHRRLTPPDAELGYGIGWIVTPDYNGYLKVGHTGGMPGVATWLNLYPGEDLAIVVLTNLSSRGIAPIADDIAEILLPKFGAARKASEAKRAAQKAAPYAPTPEILGHWGGTVRTYRGTTPLELEVQEDGDIHVKLGKQLATLLSGIAYEKGQLTGLFSGQIPTPDAERHPMVQLDLHLRGSKLAGEATAMSDAFVQPGAGPDFLSLGAITSYVELTRADK